MLRNLKISHSIILLLMVGVAASGMVYDNRYLPLMQYPYISVPGRESHLTGDFFVTTASRAIDDREREIGIIELAGPLDQAQLAYSFVLDGKPDPLDPGLLAGELPWTIRGKLQTQGFAFSYRQYLGCGFSAGVLTLAMRSNSYLDFFFNPPKTSSETPPFSPGEVEELGRVLRGMFADLGLSCNHVQQGGMGDIEAYLRWANRCEYSYKLRSLEYAGRLGVLIPTGVTRNIFHPASIPFGGNGHWGVYASGDAELEVKEDWKIGVLLRLSKRFARTRIERMPVARPLLPGQAYPSPSEPQVFGVLVGPARVNPGLSEIFSMYAQWEGIREGLGVRLQYTLVNHNQDHWTDLRVDQTVKANLEQVEKLSSWASEYVTLSAFYDFDKVAPIRGYNPIVRVAWDIPYTLLVAHKSVHSYKVVLGLEFNF